VTKDSVGKFIDAEKLRKAARVELFVGERSGILLEHAGGVSIDRQIHDLTGLLLAPKDRRRARTTLSIAFLSVNRRITHKISSETLVRLGALQSDIELVSFSKAEAERYRKALERIERGKRAR